MLLFFSLGLFFFVLNSFERLLDTFCRLKLGSCRRAIKIAYCPWAIRENPASSAANQIARFIKTNACHIIINIPTSIKSIFLLKLNSPEEHVDGVGGGGAVFIPILLVANIYIPTLLPTPNIHIHHQYSYSHYFRTPEINIHRPPIPN